MKSASRSKSKTVQVVLDPTVLGMLDRFRSHLDAEFGIQLTRSQAVRAAIRKQHAMLFPNADAAKPGH